MGLKDWLKKAHPDRGALSWFVSVSRTSFQTVGKAMRGEEIRDKGAAEKISAATNGEVSVAELMHIDRRSFRPPPPTEGKRRAG